mgnify:CR=1 FL=1
MPRLFSGIELPEDIKDQLSDLEVPLPGAFWIEEDNLHITLRFAGDIDNRLANEFAEADSPMYLSSLIALGFVLFLVTFVVLTIARLMLRQLNKREGN